jgi:hypothetical protein
MTALQHNSETLDSGVSLDRRECRRTFKQGSIAVAGKGQEMAATRLLEYTTQGARVVIDSCAGINQRVDFRLTTKSGRLDGYARIAWTAPTAHGKQVAGLEFIDFTLHTARTEITP